MSGDRWGDAGKFRASSRAPTPESDVPGEIAASRIDALIDGMHLSALYAAGPEEIRILAREIRRRRLLTGETK